MSYEGRKTNNEKRVIPGLELEQRIKCEYEFEEGVDEGFGRNYYSPDGVGFGQGIKFEFEEREDEGFGRGLIQGEGN